MTADLPVLPAGCEVEAEGVRRARPLQQGQPGALEQRVLACHRPLVKLQQVCRKQLQLLLVATFVPFFMAECVSLSPGFCMRYLHICLTRNVPIRRVGNTRIELFKMDIFLGRK